MIKAASRQAGASSQDSKLKAHCPRGALKFGTERKEDWIGLVMTMNKRIATK